MVSTLLPHIMPDVENDESGLYPNVTYDHKNRKICAFGRILGGLVVKGSTVSDKIRQQIQKVGLPGDDAGHIIPRCWGGSGRRMENIFPQHAAWNRSYGHIDKDSANWLAQNECHSIEFIYTFTYPDDDDEEEYPNRPAQYKVTIKKFYDGTLVGDPYEYTELNRDYTPADQVFISEQIQSMTPNSPNIIKKHHKDNMPGEVLSNAAKATAKSTPIVAKQMGSNVSKGMVAVKGGEEVMKGVSTAAVPVAAMIDGIRVISAIGSGEAKEVVKTGAKVGSEWGGAAAGASIGSALGPVGTVGGAVIGAVASGAVVGKVADLLFGQ